VRWPRGLRRPRLLGRLASLRRHDPAAVTARTLRQWLLVAPVLGVGSGLLVTAIAAIVLDWLWPLVLRFDLAHPLAIVPVLTAGFLAAGLIMQYLTPDPDEHSTEEVIRAYHERQGRIEMRAFVPKLIAAIATVGSGGSAALEGPSVYGGGGLGSWLWSRFRFAGLGPRDRRILLISGAAAGMSAVFRAPLTGVVFALEMPYKDDIAREALLPSLVASVAAYATMVAFLGSRPIFDFAATTGYTGRDLWWAALLGLGCGLVVTAFSVAYRRFRGAVQRARAPHWLKMAAGGALTGLCGLLFLACYPGSLIPIGPNYEAVTPVLRGAHAAGEMVTFGVLKLAATLCSLGVGGVSAMFVPLFLAGGAFGGAFGAAVVHAPAPELFAAVGMAAFLAAGYKTPLTAAVFVAEATGGHALIIPGLIGAALAYSVSGEWSVSGDQRLHEAVRVADLAHLTVAGAMRRHAAWIEAEAPLGALARLAATRPEAAYAVCERGRVVGVVSPSDLGRVPPAEWERRRVREVMERDVACIGADGDLQAALHAVLASRRRGPLFVTTENGSLEGVLTATDVLAALEHAVPPETAAEPG